jgi:hypothetical protein
LAKRFRRISENRMGGTERVAILLEVLAQRQPDFIPRGV